jgi:hypothetical protein
MGKTGVEAVEVGREDEMVCTSTNALVNDKRAQTSV